MVALRRALHLALAGFARRLLPIVGALAMLVAIAGCESKITQASYDKIQNGMSLSEVKKILGGDGIDETPSGTSITGAGVGDSRAAAQNVYRWKDGSKYIVVTFRDGKVTSKVQEGL